MTTMDVGYPGNGNALVRGWRAFKLWRRSRPFWGGLFTLLSALELWSIPFMQDAIHLHMQIKGIAGVSTMAMAPIMVVLAVAMWFFPDYRIFAGVATLICALLSMVISNFGGFLLGMLLGLLGGALGFSWSPRYTPEQLAAKARAEQAYRDALAGDVPAAASTPLGVPAEAFAFTGDAVETAAFTTVTAEDYADQDHADHAAQPADTVMSFESFDAEVPPQLPGAVEADADQDAVPSLPSAEETPLGA